MSLVLDGYDLSPGGGLADASKQFAFRAYDLLRIDAVEMQRVVGERIGLTADGREDLLLFPLHVQFPVGEPAARVLPAQLPGGLLGLDDQQDLRVGPGVRDEREEGAVHHAGPPHPTLSPIGWGRG